VPYDDGEQDDDENEKEEHRFKFDQFNFRGQHLQHHEVVENFKSGRFVQHYENFVARCGKFVENILGV
jgi:hypothetical protein